MSVLRAFFPALLGLLLLCAPAVGTAAPVAPDKNATGTAAIMAPATIRKLNDLNFAFLSVTGTGTAIVDPNTDAMTTTGGVLHAGGTPYAALFEAVSPVRGVVIVRLPREPITVTRIGGTETMTVSNWTISGKARRTVAAREPFEFKVGGTLYVNANQVEGEYVGTFTVDIQYP
jgi:hypothetical protein